MLCLGLVLDPEMGEKVRVSVIATGLVQENEKGLPLNNSPKKRSFDIDSSEFSFNDKEESELG